MLDLNLYTYVGQNIDIKYIFNEFIIQRLLTVPLFLAGSSKDVSLVIKIKILAKDINDSK